jgi:hypothetical protein
LVIWWEGVRERIIGEGGLLAARIARLKEAVAEQYDRRRLPVFVDEGRSERRRKEPPVYGPRRGVSTGDGTARTVGVGALHHEPVVVDRAIHEPARSGGDLP